MIKGKKEIETISVFDHTLNAYHEISLEDAIKQMESLGLTKEEIKNKLGKFTDEKKKRLEEIGTIEVIEKWLKP